MIVFVETLGDRWGEMDNGACYVIGAEGEPSVDPESGGG